MKIRWWMILIAALLIIALILGIFWDAILLHVMPGAVLSKSLISLFSRLEERLEGSPLTLLASGFDESGCNTAQMELHTDNALLGEVRYLMHVQTCGAPRQFQASGTVTSNGTLLELSVYADQNFAAVSSETLLDGAYYGITYDSFSQDIRSIPILPLLVGEKNIKNWEESVDSLQSRMNRSYETPHFSADDIKNTMIGLLALKPQITRGHLSLDGQEREVHAVTFTASGPEIASAAENYKEYLSSELLALLEHFRSDGSSSVSATFYLSKRDIVKFSCAISLKEDHLELELDLGKNPETSPVSMAAIHRSGGNLNKWLVDVDTEYDDQHYAESCSIVHIENGKQKRHSLRYFWDRSSGDMTLRREGEDEREVSLNLQSAGEGFRIETDQFESVVSLLDEHPAEGSSRCVMTVTAGGETEVPDYKNIDQWSGEDLVILLTGIGSLFGLQTQ